MIEKSSMWDIRKYNSYQSKILVYKSSKNNIDNKIINRWNIKDSRRIVILIRIALLI